MSTVDVIGYYCLTCEMDVHDKTESSKEDLRRKGATHLDENPTHVLSIRIFRLEVEG